MRLVLAPLVFALAASCAVPALAGDPVMCPQIWTPVCGLWHGNWKTFPNACIAHSKGATRVRKGRCDTPKFCAQIYEPVCASKNTIRKTYGNKCEAEADGASAIVPGACAT